MVREGAVEDREVEVTAREDRAERLAETLHRLAGRWATLRRAQAERVKADVEQVALLRQRAAGAPVPAEAEALADLFRTTAERLALLVYREQELADREVDAARPPARSRYREVSRSDARPPARAGAKF